MSSTVEPGLKAYPPHVFWDTPGASTSNHHRSDVRVKDEADYIISPPSSPSPSSSAFAPSRPTPSPGPTPAYLSASRSPRVSHSPSIDELQDDSPPQTSLISSRALPPSATRPYMPPGGHPILINTSFAHGVLPPLQPQSHHSGLKSESSPILSARSPHPRPGISPYTSPRDGPQSPKTPYDANASLIYSHTSMSTYSPLSPLPPIKEIKRDTVTTTATQAASANRRRNEAHFLCPVPGCGSTFTRRFNLRGHMRSHLEERPFTCDWPGCGKSFARQHDCKRHTALHSMKPKNNSCKGCGKTFSRLDALNRHLRSEGGAECRLSLGQQLLPLPTGASSLSSPVLPSPTSSFSHHLPPHHLPSPPRHGLYRVKTEPYSDEMELLRLAPIRSPTDVPTSASTESSYIMDISPTNSRSTAQTSPTDEDDCLSPRSSIDVDDD